jgi:hypothetical protein
MFTFKNMVAIGLFLFGTTFLWMRDRKGRWRNVVQAVCLGRRTAVKRMGVRR